MMDEIKLDNHY